MSNILNHNRLDFDFALNKSEYWDFHLAKTRQFLPYMFELTDKCLLSYIDTNDKACLVDVSLFSKDKFVWNDARNNGLTLENIGYTGIDNGLITYNKNEISNRQFLEIFENSTYSIPQDDYRFKVNPVDGNNLIYDYDSEIGTLNGIEVAKLNGGFYQGFFRTDDGCDYRVLPSSLENGITLEFVLCRNDFEVDYDECRYTLNDKYQGNKGIFFYMGTRAENKWWKYYDTDEKFEKSGNHYFIDGYKVDGYELDESTETDAQYFALRDRTSYFADNYAVGDYITREFDESEYDYTYIINEGYYLEDITFGNGKPFWTKDGHLLSQPNIIEYKTDNKYLMFDRTKEGTTASTWEEGTIAIITDIKVDLKENGFLLFNRTKKGYTAKSVGELYEKESKHYNVVNDIINNAFGLQITDDGRIGYKYIVRDCEAELKYKVESEYSFENVVPYGRWCVIDLRILPNSIPGIAGYHAYRKEGHKMRLMLYVNGRLVMVSRELPMLDLRILNDMYDKQEAVPFNISLGGGTQGLCDVVYANFRQLPEYALPLEEAFGGSFIGYFKSFKFYNCLLNYNEINENYEYEMNLLRGYVPGFDIDNIPISVDEAKETRECGNVIKKIAVDAGGYILDTQNLVYSSDNDGKVLGVENGELAWVSKGVGKYSGYIPAHILIKTIHATTHNMGRDINVQVFETVNHQRRMVLADTSVNENGDVTISVNVNPNGLYYNIIG